MHTVELLEEALGAARRLGYRVRQEWIGIDGGPCEIRGQRWLFLDLGMPPREQLEVVLDTLRGDPRAAREVLSPTLDRLLGARRSA